MLNKIKKSEMFSIVVDTTIDVFNLEKITFLLRYVYLEEIKER
jgi:hypothetical protein